MEGKFTEESDHCQIEPSSAFFYIHLGILERKRLGISDAAWEDKKALTQTTVLEKKHERPDAKT